VLLGCVLLLCLASVPATGRSLAPLADLRFRATWAILAAIAIQIAVISVVPGGSPALHRTAHLASYALAAAFVVANRRVPGMLVLAAGGALNAAAIAANGGVMPASAAALERAGLAADGHAFVNSTALSGARLQVLGDIFATPSWLPVANVFSVGDVLLVAGALLLLHGVCRGRGGWTAAGL
jgi:hypothetical protein